MEIGIANELGHVWEWPLGLHFVLSALVAGLSAIAGIAHLKERKDLAKIAVFFAFPILIVDLLSLILDLGKMWSVYWLYFNFNITSAISWGTWSLTLSVVCLFGYLVDHFKIFPLPKRILNLLAWLLIGSSVVVGTYTGAMFASCLQSVPLWCSMIIAPLRRSIRLHLATARARAIRSSCSIRPARAIAPRRCRSSTQPPSRTVSTSASGRATAGTTVCS